MSLGADYMADYAFEMDHPFGIADKNNPVWTTKDGQKIKVSDMTNSHIRNCMKFVANYEGGWYGVFARELEKRGETAQAKENGLPNLKAYFLTDDDWARAEWALDDGFYPFIGWLPDQDNPVWTMKDGQEIKVSDMTDSHIRNCMRLLDGGIGVQWWLDVFARELDKRAKESERR